MLELRTTKTRNSFGVVLSYNSAAKLSHGVEDADGSKANCKSSDPSHRKKQELDEDFVAQASDYLDSDEKSTICQHCIASRYYGHLDEVLKLSFFL